MTGSSWQINFKKWGLSIRMSLRTFQKLSGFSRCSVVITTIYSTLRFVRAVSQNPGRGLSSSMGHWCQPRSGIWLAKNQYPDDLEGLHSVKSDASFYRFAAPLEKLLDWLLFEVQQSNADQYGQRSATVEEGIHEELLNDIVKEIQGLALEYAVQRKLPLKSDEDGDPWYEAAGLCCLFWLSTAGAKLW